MRILTIDGAGLQGASTVLILNAVLDAYAKQNGCRKPRPCDLFDTIAGIGAGAWLAILLGRFRMDLAACLAEWYVLVDRTAKMSKPKGRILRHINRLVKFYGIDGCLFESRPQGVRTRHVFVAASQPRTRRSGDTTYNIFRSYEISKSAMFPQWLREGPANPSSFKISSAFEVAGASMSIIPEWSEQMEASGKISFRNSKPPSHHNITGLALDEMWAIHGSDVPISVVLNIGPGVPPDTKGKAIAPSLEKEMEQDIQAKLDRVYPSGSEMYFRLAPPNTTPFTAEDRSEDRSAVSSGNRAAILDFLNDEHTRNKIDELAKRLSQPGNPSNHLYDFGVSNAAQELDGATLHSFDLQ